MAEADLADRGYVVLPWDAGTAAWAVAARQVARAVTQDPQMRATWLRHGQTWFAGVDVLPNAPDGGVAGQALQGPCADLIRAMGLWPDRWHAGQISVTYPGYPAADPHETPGAVRFRRNRDAAHLDGLHLVPPKRRMLREPHAFILGLPLTEADPNAAPLVVWPGSHRILRAALAEALMPHAPDRWGEVDLTEVYTKTRRLVFDQCPRVPVQAHPGEAILVHRLMLHGVAPWTPGAQAAADGRMIAYFRPCFSDPSRWLQDP